MVWLTTLLRDPRSIADGDEAVLSHLGPRLLGVVLVGGGVLGAVFGAQEGPLQALYAAVKLPLLLLVPLLVAVPAMRALTELVGAPISATRAALSGLVGAALTALLALAAAPVVWLILATEPGYHTSVLLLAATLGIAGLPGVRTMAKAMGDAAIADRPMALIRWWLVLSGALLIFGSIAAQTGWLLRPFVVRPDAEVVFLRGAEGDVFGSLGHHLTAPRRER